MLGDGHDPMLGDGRDTMLEDGRYPMLGGGHDPVHYIACIVRTNANWPISRL